MDLRGGNDFEGLKGKDGLRGESNWMKGIC